MTAYVHTPRQHQPDKYAALLAEKARLEAETRLYETLTAQRKQLAAQMAAFHKHDHPAERIRHRRGPEAHAQNVAGEGGIHLGAAEPGRMCDPTRSLRHALPCR